MAFVADAVTFDSYAVSCFAIKIKRELINNTEDFDRC